MTPDASSLQGMLLKAALPLIVMLALMLRLYGISWGLPDATHLQATWHPDEVLSLDLAEYLFMGQPQEKNFMYGGTLFFSFLHFLVSLGRVMLPLSGGHTLLETTLVIGRLVMVLISLGTLGLLYGIGKQLFGKSGGLLTALCAAIMPALVIWSQRLRPDELAAFLVTLMVWLALQVYHHEGRRQQYYLLAAGLLSGVLLSYRFPLLVFGLMPLMALLMQRGFHLTLSDCWRLLFPLPFFIYVVALPLGYIITSPHSLWYPQLLYQGLAVQFGYQSQVFADSLGQGPKFVQAWWSMLHQGLGYPLYFGSLAGVALALRNRQQWGYILAVALLPYMFFLVATSWVVVRYTLPIMPLLCIFCAYALLVLHKSFARVAWSVATLAVMLTLLADLAYLRLEAGTNIRQDMGRWLTENLQPEDCVVMFRSYVEETFFNPVLPADLCHEIVDLPGTANFEQADYPYFTDYYRQTLAGLPFTYLLVHEYHYGNMDRLQAQHPSPAFAGLYTLLTELPLELVRTEERPPVLAGLDFSRWFSAHDLRYVNPGFRLYRLQGSDSEAPSAGI